MGFFKTYCLWFYGAKAKRAFTPISIFSSSCFLTLEILSRTRFFETPLICSIITSQFLFNPCLLVKGILKRPSPSKFVEQGMIVIKSRMSFTSESEMMIQGRTFPASLFLWGFRFTRTMSPR